MPIYKPYKPAPDARPPPELKSLLDLKQGPLSGGPLPASAVILSCPPPPTLYVYQMLPDRASGPPLPVPDGLPPPGLSSVPPLPGFPPTPNAPVSESKPRIVHEYYDAIAFQWKEFNPEETVIGDETDPFIVYYRYTSKSIGARRTAWILPKHPKLTKILQDCNPDFDWRKGEDLLVSLSQSRSNCRSKVGRCIFDGRN